MTNEEYFLRCKAINDLLSCPRRSEAHGELFLLLKELSAEGKPYGALLNHLIRECGLFQYMDTDNVLVSDRIVRDVFSVDIGEAERGVLHIGQSKVLKELLRGEDVVVSAPTSFGKSYLIDAFIAIRSPKNVIVIVPTLSLMDEARRRLQRKFAPKYKIITTSDAVPSEYNIYVFPQERALGIRQNLSNIDLLVVDEFYKASTEQGDDRTDSLMSAIMNISPYARQKFYLTPKVEFSPDAYMITQGMQHLTLDYETVLLKIHDDYKSFNKTDELKRDERLFELISKKRKTLVYTGSVALCARKAQYVASKLQPKTSTYTQSMAQWIAESYGSDYLLVELVKKGVGCHSGQLHRTLGQLIIKSFERIDGLDSIFATSSIIEGVNTSAEYVIVYNSKIATRNLNNFMFKNIIGRGGRMFKYFVGEVYLLDSPPAVADDTVSFSPSEDVIDSIYDEEATDLMTEEQKERNREFHMEMDKILGNGEYRKMLKDELPFIKGGHIAEIARDIKDNLSEWSQLTKLNNPNSAQWPSGLVYRLIRLSHANGAKYSDIYDGIVLASKNWTHSLPQLIRMARVNRPMWTADDYFKIERIYTYHMPNVVSAAVAVYNRIVGTSLDLSACIANVSNAFMPKLVMQLEEYSLPRMLSRKLQDIGIINLEDSDLTIDDAIAILLEKRSTLTATYNDAFSVFEKDILEYFFEGVS